ncbi:hypothetical protein CS006_09115 [Bifidobacterium primatium]|uniref:Uncharacterized protein n=2 Tax=Bifidobacterium TaxID=1678 RepID=A0A2M9H7C3_9BIFI|nr:MULTISPECIES: hypothetical protein [Bifidobacterium]NEG95667.1 hypothetical protein [Bifidobacterium sp. SMB2]NEH11094.1 hypothetical protein [Bifidobacterium saimiriisciurei]PJM72709.1 hypothetical protein CS006_09115 [Bifidobacterium primatium]
MQSSINDIILWYGQLPDTARTLVTVVVGAIVAYVVFKIVVRLLSGLLAAAIAAALAFLLTTVPGNMLLSQAYDRIEQEVSNSSLIQ